MSDEGSSNQSLLEENSSLGSLHVSAQNQGEAGSPGGSKCRIALDSTETGAQSDHHRSVCPCTWNGDIAHGVIATGATVAREVDAKLPKVCHRASYTVTVGTKNAPVRFQPITLNTPVKRTFCSDSKLSVITSSPVPRPGVPAKSNPGRVNWGLPVDVIRLAIEITGVVI